MQIIHANSHACEKAVYTVEHMNFKFIYSFFPQFITRHKIKNS